MDNDFLEYFSGTMIIMFSMIFCIAYTDNSFLFIPFSVVLAIWHIFNDNRQEQEHKRHMKWLSNWSKTHKPGVLPSLNEMIEGRTISKE